MSTHPDIEEHSDIRLRFNNYDIANTAPIEITFSQVANKLSILGNYPLRDTDEVEWQFPRKWDELHQVSCAQRTVLVSSVLERDSQSELCQLNRSDESSVRSGSIKAS